MEIPTTFSALAVKILTDVVFLGLVSALLTGGLWRLLEEYGHWTVPANWKRLGSLLMPFLLTGAFYLIQAGRGALPWSIEAYYQAFLAALSAAVGKQLAFTGYTAARGTGQPGPDGIAYRPITLPEQIPPPKGVSFDTEPRVAGQSPPAGTIAEIRPATSTPSAIPGEHNYITSDDLSGIPTLPDKGEVHDG